MVAFYVLISLGLFAYAAMLGASAAHLRKRGREKGPSARSMVLACVVTVIFALLTLGRALPPVQAMLPMMVIVPVMFVSLVAYMISSARGSVTRRPPLKAFALVGLIIVGVWLGTAYLRMRIVLDGADTVVLYSLNPQHERSREKPIAQDRLFHHYEILGSMEVAGLDRSSLANAFAWGIVSPALPAKCFNPRHGMRVIKGGLTIDYVVCFECHQYFTITGSETSKYMLVASPAQITFDRILTAHGVQLGPR